MSIVLLTGATGFVGRQIQKVLQEKGCQIRLVIREGSQSRIVNMKGVESIISTQDLFAESSTWWEKSCDGVDTVIHSAWYAEPGQYLQSDKNLDCLIGTMNLAKGASKAGVKRFGGIGTCFEYKMSPNKPLSIHDPLGPSSPYAGAKAATFIALSQYFSKRRISFVWFRLFYLYGDHEDSRKLGAYLHKQLSLGQPVKLTNGNQVRDFMDVSEAAQDIVRISLGSHEGVANICSGIPITVREFSEKIADQYGRRDLLNFGGKESNSEDPVHVVGVKEVG